MLSDAVVVLPVAAGGVLVGALTNQLAFSIPRADASSSRMWAPRWHPTSVPRPILELVTGLLFAGLAVIFGLSWVLPAYLYLATVAVLLCVIDVQHRILPNVIVYPSFVMAAALLCLAAVGQDQPRSLGRAALGSLVLFGFFFLSALITPAGVGMGDVKLSAVLGLYLGYLGWAALLVGVFVAFVLAAVVGLALMAAGRAGRKSMLPFGPALLAGTFVAIAHSWLTSR